MELWNTVLPGFKESPSCDRYFFLCLKLASNEVSRLCESITQTLFGLNCWRHNCMIPNTDVKSLLQWLNKQSSVSGCVIHNLENLLWTFIFLYKILEEEEQSWRIQCCLNAISSTKPIWETKKILHYSVMSWVFTRIRNPPVMNRSK